MCVTEAFDTTAYLLQLLSQVHLELSNPNKVGFSLLLFFHVEAYVS